MPATSPRPPVVSIGLPVYNGERYLEMAVASLLSQTFGDFQLIISDNASTDATEEISRRLARSDPRIEYHRHQTNRGAPANYNFALARATGELFLWHTHDDLRGPQFLELAVEAHRQTLDLAVVFSKAVIIDPDSRPLRAMPRPDALLSRNTHRRVRAAITCEHPDLIIFGLMKRKVLKGTRGHGAFIGADRLLAVELALRSRFVELPETMFLNHDHPGRYIRIAAHDEAARAAWWDPTSAARFSMPRWKGLAGYIAAVFRAPIGPLERARCLGSIAASLGDHRLLSDQAALP